MNTTNEIQIAAEEFGRATAHLIQAIFSSQAGPKPQADPDQIQPAPKPPTPPSIPPLQSKWTTEPVKIGYTSGMQPEFGRWQDVQRLFGIKRGKLYEMINAGLVKSISLRRKGQKHSCRLVHLDSVREYLWGQMDEQDS